MLVEPGLCRLRLSAVFFLCLYRKTASAEVPQEIDVAWADLVAQAALDAGVQTMVTGFVPGGVSRVPEQFLRDQNFRARWLAFAAAYAGQLRRLRVSVAGTGDDTQWPFFVLSRFADQLDAVYGAGVQTQLASCALVGQNRMHELRGTHYGVHGTGLDAPIAAYAEAFVDPCKQGLCRQSLCRQSLCR
jgi:hypothetical protein